MDSKNLNFSKTVNWGQGLLTLTIVRNSLTIARVSPHGDGSIGCAYVCTIGGHYGKDRSI